MYAIVLEDMQLLTQMFCHYQKHVPGDISRFRADIRQSSDYIRQYETYIRTLVQHIRTFFKHIRKTGLCSCTISYEI